MKRREFIVGAAAVLTVAPAVTATSEPAVGRQKLWIKYPIHGTKLDAYYAQEMKNVEEIRLSPRNGWVLVGANGECYHVEADQLYLSADGVCHETS